MDVSRILIALLVASCGGDKARSSTAAPVRLAPVEAPAEAPAVQPAVEMDRSKDADAVTRRFGVPMPAGPIPGRIGGGAQPGKVASAVMLVATHVSSDDQLSFATVVNKQTGGGGYYGVGDEIPTAGRITRIAPRRIAYVDGVGETCMLDLIPASDSTAAPGAPAAASGKAPATDGPTAVSRAELESVLADPRSAGARLQPSGTRMKLYAVRKGGLAERLGFRNGDVIASVAGVALTNADAALEALQRARSSDRVSVQVERDSGTITLTFAVHD